MTTIVCMGGKAQSGKDTSARLLKDKLTQQGKSVIVAHYADLLKYVCKAFFEWDELKDANGRSLLQRVGTDVVRAQEPNFWVDFIVKMVGFFGDSWDYVIIPDTRFPNEIERWESAGYPTYYIRVERPTFDNGLTDEQQCHPSETALDNFAPNAMVNNWGSMTQLQLTISDIATKLEAYGKDIENRREFRIG